MTIWIRRLMLALMVGCMPMVAQAGSIDDAHAAEQRGDHTTATSLYRVLAEQGDAGAQFNLGVMYAQGRGVAKNEQQTYFWWLLSAAQGDEFAFKGRDLVEKQLTAQQRAAAQAQAREWRPAAVPTLK